MPRITKPLTSTEIKNSKPKSKEYKLNDGGGLSFRVRINGTKDWIFRYYEPFTKKRKDISFGSFPTVSLADARNKRDQAKKLLDNNIDPKAHQLESKRIQTEEQANTLLAITKEWMTIKETTVSLKFAVQIMASLNNHVLPRLGNIAVDKLTPALVIEVLNPIAAKGNAETVRRLCQRINEILDFAVNTGRLQINTLSKINSAFIAPTKKNLPALKPEELPVFLNTLQKASIKLVTRALIEWQLNTMVRPSEAAMAEWQEIDYDNKLWVIPAHKMKKKSNGDHSVPLTKQTLALLEMMKPISGYGQHIFPADRDPKTHVNSQTANMAIKRMGYKDKLVSHGMRSIASTVLNEEGFDYDVIETSLAHVDKNTVRRAYNRTDYLERRRVLMQWWSDYIENASKGSCTLGASEY